MAPNRGNVASPCFEEFRIFYKYGVDLIRPDSTMPPQKDLPTYDDRGWQWRFGVLEDPILRSGQLAGNVRFNFLFPQMSSIQYSAGLSAPTSQLTSLWLQMASSSPDFASSAHISGLVGLQDSTTVVKASAIPQQQISKLFRSQEVNF